MGSLADRIGPSQDRSRTLTRGEFIAGLRHGYAGWNGDGSAWFMYLDPQYGTTFATITKEQARELGIFR